MNKTMSVNGEFKAEEMDVQKRIKTMTQKSSKHNTHCSR